MELPIENKVEKANIKQIDLSDFVNRSPIKNFDLKEGLWQGMVVKEKEFRDFIKHVDWSHFQSQNVGVFCSVDAIIPAWAYMLVTTHLVMVGARVFFDNTENIEELLFFDNLSHIDTELYKDQRVMVKGCSNIPNPTKAYIELSKILVPIVKSLMFGEPCSAVPVYKRHKALK